MHRESDKIWIFIQKYILITHGHQDSSHSRDTSLKPDNLDQTLESKW